MHIRIEFQLGGKGEITLWEGSWDGRNYWGGASEAVRSYHQFMEGYEPHGWFWSNMTADEFDAKFDAGQRLFHLVSNSTVYIVRLWREGGVSDDNPWKDLGETKAKLRDLDEAYDSIICDAGNFISGHDTLEQFKKLFVGYEMFGKDRDWKAMEKHLMETYRSEL